MGRTKTTTKRAPAAQKAPKGRPYTVRALSAAYAFYRHNPRATSVSHSSIRAHFVAQDKKHPERTNQYSLARVRTAKAQLAEDQILVRDDGVQLRLGDGVKEAIKALRIDQGDDSSDDERAVASYLASNPRPSPATKTATRTSKPAPTARKRARPSTSADPPPKKSRAAPTSDSESDAPLATRKQKKKSLVIRETKAQLLARVKELEQSVRNEGRRAKALEADVEKLQAGYEELQARLEQPVQEDDDEPQDELASGPGSDLGGMDLADHGFEDLDDSGFFDAKLSDAGSDAGEQSPTLKATHSWSASVHPLSPAASRAGSPIVPTFVQSSSPAQGSSSPQGHRAHVDSLERHVAQLPSPELSSSPTKQQAPASEAGSILDFDAEIDLQARVEQLEQELVEARKQSLPKDGTSTFANCSTNTPSKIFLAKATNTDHAPLVSCGTLVDFATATEALTLLNCCVGTEPTPLVHRSTSTTAPSLINVSTSTSPAPFKSSFIQTEPDADLVHAREELQIHMSTVAELSLVLSATESLLSAEQGRSENLQYELDVAASMYRDRTNELLKQESEMVVLKTDLDRARVHSSLLGYHLVAVRVELENASNDERRRASNLEHELADAARLYLDLSDDCTAKESEIDSLEMDRGRAKVHVELLEYHLVDARVELDGAREKIDTGRQVERQLADEQRTAGNLKVELADASRSYQDLSAVFIAHRASTDALELKYSLAKMHTELLAHFLSLAREEIDSTREAGKQSLEDEQRRSGNLNAELTTATRLYQDLAVSHASQSDALSTLSISHARSQTLHSLLSHHITVARSNLSQLDSALRALLAVHSLTPPPSATPLTLLSTLSSHLDSLITQHTDDLLESSAFASDVRLAFEGVVRALGGRLDEGGIGVQLYRIVRSTEEWAKDRAGREAQLEKDVVELKDRTRQLEEHQTELKSRAGEVAGLLRRASSSKFWDDVGVELEP